MDNSQPSFAKDFDDEVVYNLEWFNSTFPYYVNSRELFYNELSIALKLAVQGLPHKASRIETRHDQ